MTIQEILKPYGINVYQDFLRSTRGILSYSRANQIWFRKTGIGRRTAKQLHHKLDWPYALLVSAEPKDGRNRKRK